MPKDQKSANESLVQSATRCSSITHNSSGIRKPIKIGDLLFANIVVLLLGKKGIVKDTSKRDMEKKNPKDYYLA